MDVRRRVERWSGRLLADVGTIRRGVLYIAIIALAWSLAVSPAAYPYTSAPVVLVSIPVLALVAWRWRARRADLFAAGAAGVALVVPDVLSLWAAAAALTYLSVYEERREVPWAAIAGGLSGAIASSVVYPDVATPAPYVAVLFGLGVGMLVRSLDRLEGETQRLRLRTRRSEEQARWLEQRTSLARELHDVVGHHVTAMVVQSEAGLVSDPRAALGTIGDLGRAALTELDALVVHLRDPDAPVTVTAPPRLSDIDELLAAPLRHQGVDVSVRVDADPGLDEVGVLTAYRIAQEALTNVTRHAGASAAWVELARSGEHVRLRVSDDGVGPPAEVRRGAGLVGIEERVRSVDGRWDMSERPGGGTIVDVLLPVPAT